MSNKVRINADYPVVRESDELFSRAQYLIPSATHSLAAGAGQYVNGVAPKYIVRGKGSHVWDIDGNEYLDYNMAFGPLSLGYTYAKVDEAIKRQLDDGITFSLSHPLEVEVAELISELVPNADQVRFSKTGADVTSAAVRAARAFTGRNKVLCCGYHGWHDWFISITDRNRGVPKPVSDLTYTFEYNNLKTVANAIDRDTACVILEPVAFQAPRDNFLHKLQDLCTDKGVLLIFDEMWTGFRLELGGAQEYFGVKPDLACFSKAVANGMPLSVLTGRRDIMSLLDDEVFIHTTFGGETLSLAAARATITELKEKNVPYYLATQGKRLKEGYNMIAGKLNMDYTVCTGYNCRTAVSFNQEAGDPMELLSLMQQEMIRCGILWSGVHNISYSHSDRDIDYT
ncbi:MAG: aminotransferase class III-fold pyridoxal phosphate-dependent enzyme, partial [Syntrophothermus sp.]